MKENKISGSVPGFTCGPAWSPPPLSTAGPVMLPTLTAGRPDALLQHHPCYLTLGKDDQTRQEAYRALFQHDLDAESLLTIRKTVNSGLALGGERFKDQIEAVLARSVRAEKPGRPRKRCIEADASEECTFAQGVN